MKAPATLVPAAKQAIQNCVGNTTRVMGSGETAEVARLALHLPDALVRAWKPFLAAGELDVVGVFSHATPKTRWIDPRTGKTEKPELCDLLLMLDCEDAGGRMRRALMVQAKPESNGVQGEFSVGNGPPSIQRYLYVHWPPFELTGLGSPAPSEFRISPQPPGSCVGTRYACVNIGAPSAASGWWVEDAQPKAPGGRYHGSYKAKLPLENVLHSIVAGKLGAPLLSGSEWERMVSHLFSVAETRGKAGKSLSHVKATASGTVLPHVASASLFLANAALFFDSKAMTGHYGWEDLLQPTHEPPRFERPPFVAEEEARGFGIVYIRLIAPEWRSAIPNEPPRARR